MKARLRILAILGTIAFGAQGSAEAADGPLAKALAEKASAGGKAPSDAAKIMQTSAEELRRSTLLSTAAKIGDKLPSFELPGPDGKPVSSAKMLAEGSMILTFYRGGWCPFYNIQLRAYQVALPEFRKRNAMVVAVSPETVENATATSEKTKADFRIATDSNNDLARKLGLVFHVSDELKRVYLGFGIDLSKSQGNSDWNLPIPATYVVDRDGVIRWAFVDVDYKKRAEPADIVKALDEVVKGSKTH